jgi:hypothetical protein
VSKPLAVNLLEFRVGKSLILPFYKLKFPASSLDMPITHVTIGRCPHMELAVSAVTTVLLRESIGRQHVGLPGVIPDVRRSKIPYRDW